MKRKYNSLDKRNVEAEKSWNGKSDNYLHAVVLSLGCTSRSLGELKKRLKPGCYPPEGLIYIVWVGFWASGF